MLALGAGLFVRAGRRPPKPARERVIVITGGARGFGLALARRFAHHGRLFLLSRNLEELRRAQRELEMDGATVDVVVCDVRDARAVEQAVAVIVRAAGHIDVLVNNAGIIQVTPFAHATEQDFRDSLDTHFWGPLHLIQASLAHMRPGSSIVNISSIGGRVAIPHLLPYCVGKFALAALSDGLHAELARDGISVTTVTPWLMQTGSHRNAVVRGRHEREAQWFALGSASRLTAGNADQFARMVVHGCLRRRARVRPGWQARVTEIANALLPRLTAASLALVNSVVLPSPREDRDKTGYVSRDIDLGGVAELLPTDKSRRFNQPAAVGEMG